MAEISRQLERELKEWETTARGFAKQLASQLCGVDLSKDMESPDAFPPNYMAVAREICFAFMRLHAGISTGRGDQKQYEWVAEIIAKHIPPITEALTHQASQPRQESCSPSTSTGSP